MSYLNVDNLLNGHFVVDLRALILGYFSLVMADFVFFDMLTNGYWLICLLISTC